jgi:hypothetical protein
MKNANIGEIMSTKKTYKEIEIKCKGTIYLNYKKLNEFQEDIKILTKKNEEKLKNSIINKGFKAPIFIWKNKNKYWILDGHQRKKVLNILVDEGWNIPEIPCVEIFSKTKKEAKSDVLIFTSQHGDFDNKKIQQYIEYYSVNIEEIVLKKSEINFNSIMQNIYSKKITTPIYEIQGKKPALNKLYDDTRTKEIIEKIKKSNITKAKKDFLIKAAQRHLVFNYQNIAEFYAHEDKEMQELMEDSALVIIDFKSAIEKGFIHMSEEIMNQYGEENE